MPGAKPAYHAVIQFPGGLDVTACFEQVTEQKGRSFVPWQGGMQGQFVSTIGVVVARVAAQLCGARGRRQVL